MKYAAETSVFLILSIWGVVLVVCVIALAMFSTHVLGWGLVMRKSRRESANCRTNHCTNHLQAP